MGTLEEEELDYDENMDDLDLHPTGTLDDGDGLTIHIEETTPKGKGELVHGSQDQAFVFRKDFFSSSFTVTVTIIALAQYRRSVSNA